MSNPWGIDIASYQGFPDMARVKAAGAEFVFVKATEGISYVNPTFSQCWKDIKLAGMYRGAYHYANPDHNPGWQEAEFFHQTVMRLGGIEPGDILALDIEEGTGDLSTWTMEFMQHLATMAGFPPIIYTSRGFIDAHNLASAPSLGTYGLWLASWQVTMPPAPHPWNVVAFWQYSASGEVDGVDGPVDLDQFNGPADRIPLYGCPYGGNKPVPDGGGLDPRVIAIAHLCDIIVPQATHDPAAALAEAKRIREQFVGPKP